MFLGNDKKVYILDKVEGNPTLFNDHPVWAAVWDIETRTATPMDMLTNPFCSAGGSLPNGSFAVFGGNGAVGPGGNISDITEPGGFIGKYSTTYQDWDGTTQIRILNPCNQDNDDLVSDPQCTWDDNSTTTMMHQRWYPGCEALGDGTLVILGGFSAGGYVNRNIPNLDPEFEGGACTSTVEFFPPNGQDPTLQFLIQTSGLNAYPHTFLMPSGKMFIQANYSTST